MNSLKGKLEVVLAEHLDAEDGSHDIHHARRVLANAEEMVRRAGGGNLRFLTAAAYLHDLVNVPKDSDQRDQASRLSAEAAGPILKELGFLEEEIETVQHMIEAHSFSAGINPETLDAEILQDADRLEALGALGIARTFYTAGKMNSSLFHGDDPFGESRALDDRNYAVDHFKVKLLGLAETMKTDAGREVAHERKAFMERFLEELSGEISP
ncbi:HD domain-containing protein [Akkermansiaceae bacterium]|nr:HD domain-containing protein [Akkermansiaceae bacterium]